MLIAPLIVGPAHTREATSTRPVIGHAQTVPGIIVANIASNARIEKGTRNQDFIGLCNDTWIPARVPWRFGLACIERGTSHLVFSLYPQGVLTHHLMNEAKAKKLKSRVNRISDQGADEMFALFVPFYEANWRLFPDVLPCLELLRGQKIGILTNGDPEQQRCKLERFGLFHRFDVVIILD